MNLHITLSAMTLKMLPAHQGMVLDSIVHLFTFYFLTTQEELEFEEIRSPTSLIGWSVISFHYQFMILSAYK